MRELTGVNLKNADQVYQSLVQKVVPLRKAFRAEPSVAGRNEIASEEFNAWMSYLNSRKSQITAEMPDFQIEAKTKILLKEQFDRLKHRDTLGIPSNEIVDFHGNFAKKFRFAVPIHPRNLAQMIHPYWGYLSHFPNKHFRFEELMEVYEN